MYNRILPTFLLTFFFLCTGLQAEQADTFEDYLSARKAGFLPLYAGFPNNEAVDLMSATIGATPDQDVPYTALAHALFMQRHFAKAAFLFSVDIDINPEHYESYSNLAGLLVELNADAPEKFTTPVLDWALAAARHGAANLPDTALAHNTLSNAALARHQAGGDDALLGEAAEAANRAVSLDPDEPLLWSNLARVYHALDEGDEAKQALDMARQIDPNDPGYWVAAIALGRDPQPQPEPKATDVTQPRQCKVDFKCDLICVGGLLARGPNIVTCKLEESDQLLNCQAGKKYATGYNCAEHTLLFGQTDNKPRIKFCAPNICFTFIPDGKGGFQLKAEASRSFGPVDGYLKVEGGYSPSKGFSFDKVVPGVKLSVFNKSIPGGQHAKFFKAASSVSVGPSFDTPIDAHRKALIGF